MFEFAAQSLPSSAAGWMELLVGVSLKATVLLAAAAVLALLLRRASAASRHLTWGLALAGLLVMPLVAVWGPGVAMKGLALPSIEASAARSAALVPVGLPSDPQRVNPEPAPALVGPEAPESGTPMMADPTPAAPARWSWQAILLAVWAMGAVTVLASLVLGAVALARLSRFARPVSDPEWLDLASDCARALGLERRFDLWSSDRIPMPCAWGLVRARVMIPSCANAWSYERRRAVLLHELGHVVRRDCLVQTLAQVACALYWFHPLAWLSARQLRVERERACDDLVLAAEVGAADYAEHLLAVVREMRAPDLRAIGAVAFARRSQFEGRLLAVLDPDQRRGAVTARRLWRTALAAALVIVPIAALRPWTGHANAGLTLLDGKRARPEDGAPSSLERAPESVVGLARRLDWAMKRGAKAGGEGFWIAYQVARYDKEGGNLSDNGSIDLGTLDKDWTGPRMADVIAGHTVRESYVVPDVDALVVAFHLVARAGGPEDVDRVRAQSLELPAAFGRQPLMWLGRVEDRESLEWLRRVERSAGKTGVRSAALDAIALHGDAEAVRGQLVAVLRSDAPQQVRATAAERLGRFSDHSTMQLLSSTVEHDRSREVREGAIEALGRMHSEESTRYLSALARDASQSETSRRLAVEALGEKASAEADEYLESLAMPDSDPEPDAEAPAEEDLAVLKDHEDLKDKTVRIVPRDDGQDVVILDDQGRPEVTIEQRRDTKADKWTQEVKDGKKAESSREKARQDEEEAIQRQAVQSLARLPEASSLPKLIKIARTHSSRSVRREAISGLGQIGSPKALDALREMAWQDDEDELARAAVDALNQTENSLDLILELVRRHPRTAVRREAVQSLSHHGPEAKVLDALDDLLRDDPDDEVQREAVSAIVQLPEKYSLSRLEKIARSHPRASVRRQAIDELSHLDPERVTPILESLIGQGGKDSR